MKRKIFNINKMDKSEADIMNKSLEELYQHKIEETYHTNSASTLQLKTYRQAETGIGFYANATATTFNHVAVFSIKYNNIFNVEVTPIGTAIRTLITDVTQSQMTIKINATSTSTEVKFFYKITGSLE